MIARRRDYIKKEEILKFVKDDINRLINKLK